ncbi:MAG TPA: phosphatase PAP2 family protein [Micromonosporaceae bacterium]|jgi:hypothetical protein
MDTRRPPLWWELPFALVAFLACAALPRFSLGDRDAVSVANARQVVDLERFLGIDVETPVNRWFADQGWLTTIAGYHYASVYVLTSIAMLVYLYLRDPPTYRWARRASLVLNVLAALCFWLYPVAPPRLNPELSIVDTVMLQHIWGTWGSPVGNAVNQLAALPSLHFAWVLWVLVMLVVTTRPRPRLPGPRTRRRSRTATVLLVLASADVVITGVVVVVTGNHYPLDLLAAAVIVAVSIPVTRPWSPPTRKRFAARLGRLGTILQAKAILVED